MLTAANLLTIYNTIKTIGMRSERNNQNHSTAVVMLTDHPTDHLGLEGDLGRIRGWRCSCPYKAGSIGNICKNINLTKNTVNSSRMFIEVFYLLK